VRCAGEIRSTQSSPEATEGRRLSLRRPGNCLMVLLAGSPRIFTTPVVYVEKISSTF